MDLKDDIVRIEGDVKEIKQDVKALMMFMAVEQAKNKQSTIVFSGVVSFIVSAASFFLGKLL